MSRIETTRVGMLALLAALSGVTACGGGGADRDLNLLGKAEAEKPQDAEAAAEAERLRKLQRIVFQEIDASGQPMGDPTERDVDQFASQNISDACMTRVHDNFPRILGEDYWDLLSNGSLDPRRLGVEATINIAAAEVCIGEKLKEIAEASAAPVDYTIVSRYNQAREIVTRRFRVLPQSDATRAALYAAARQYFLKGTLRGVDLFDTDEVMYRIVYCPPTGGCSGPTVPLDLFYSGIEDWERGELVARLAQAISAGASGYEQATLAAVEKTVAVADWQRGTVNSPTVSASRVWSGQQLSRAAAAHMLVGGTPGLQISGQAIKSFCIQEAMTPSVRRAMAAFREVGMPSYLISSATYDTLTLVESLECNSGSVRERLAAKRKDDRLLSNLTAQEAVGATLEDFRIARNYLKQEQEAFGAPTTTERLRKLALHCSRLPGVVRSVDFDYTTAVPAERDDQWFVAVARTGLNWETPVNLVDLAQEGAPELGLSQFYEIVGDTIAHRLSPQYGDPRLVSLGVNRMTPLTSLMAHIEEQQTGRIWWVVDPNGVDAMVRLELRRGIGEGPLYLVEGYGAAECFARGTSYGEPQPLCPQPVATLSYYPGITPGWEALYQADFSTSGTVLDSEPLFIVGPRPDGKGNTIIAGLFENLIDFEAQGHRSIIGVAPSVESKVAQVLKPGKNWCSRPAYECGGKDPFDKRLPLEMPLENELNTDNDGLESSWRYYLDRAAAAAEQADQLGEVYLSSALDIERDKEADEDEQIQKQSEVDRELQVVQEVCGTAVDSKTLMMWIYPLGPSYPTNVQSPGYCDGTNGCSGGRQCINNVCACTSDDQCTQAGFSQCLMGKCVKAGDMGLISGTENVLGFESRLYECLGEATVLPWVSAGDTNLCFWDYKPEGQMRSIPCYNATQWQTCPQLVLGTEETSPCAAARDALGLTEQNAPIKLAKDHLGLFSVMDVWKDYTEKVVAHTHYLDEISHEYTNEENVAQALVELNGYRSGTRNCAEIDFDAFYQSQQSGGSIRINDKQLEAFLNKVTTILECQQRGLILGLAGRVFANVPDRVASALKSSEAVVGAYPAVGGSYGEQLVGMRATLNRFALHADLIREEFQKTIDDYVGMVDIVKEMGLNEQISLTGDEISDLQRQKSKLNMNILELQKDAAIIEGTTKMIQAAASTDWMNPWSAAGSAAGIVGAEMMMDNQLEQLEQQQRIAEVENQIMGLNDEIRKSQEMIQALESAKQLAAYRTSLRGRALNIKNYIKEMRTAYEEFDGALVGLENERLRALRAFNRAIQVMGTENFQEQVVERTLDNLTRLRQERYEETRKNAVRWAILAKRAIEQRLGISLANMTEPMALLDQAPSVWENEICTASGINIETLKTASNAPQVFAGAYVGDYVQKLRNLVESYRIRYGFSDGTDQMVVSLKEEIHQVKETCRVPSRNLIRMSGEIPSEVGAYGVSSPWEGTVCGITEPGEYGDAGDTSIARAAHLCAATPNEPAHLTQDVQLNPGTYLLSWYAPSQYTADMHGFKLRTSSGVLVAPIGAVEERATSIAGQSRYVAAYQILTAATYQVYADGVGDGRSDWSQYLAAPMLELATEVNRSTVNPAVWVPTDFQATDANGMHESETCEDVDGSTFRPKHWIRKCVSMCDDGLGTGCLLSLGPARCFWETSFDLSQRDIERGLILPQGGFASGNFNYRIEEVGVNFVGTSLRRCEANSGLACYAKGFIPYSLIHTGPFTVINHAGDAFTSTLFDGRIEHAKGLALERYLSNPLSSADTGLIQPYLRREFMGRPLDGTYTLRVWGDEGFSFGTIEDVQLFVKYRYWTRLN